MINFKQKIFSSIHLNNLVYNTCWEDPRCDRQLLQLQANSKVVMITSAGCNALDYLLDGPSSIDCIDMNPRQNALLELKRASFRAGSFEQHFKLFGKGRDPEVKKWYQEQLRAFLPDFAAQYWDKHIHFFNGKGIRKTFYHHSTSGFFAWTFERYLKLKKRVHELIARLFEAQNLEEQRVIYEELEPKIINNFVEWFMNKHLTMCLLGVPKSQQDLFATRYDRGVVGFVQECLRKVFTQLPVQDNYFWKLYFQGCYDLDCCPEYLVASNFETLRNREDRVQTHTTTVSQFLKDHPGPYTHFVLLDHQDWLAANNREALEEEWRLILENSQPGTRILLRSAAFEVDFFPDFVLERIAFEQELTQKTHFEDRVGTYASVYLGIVQ